MRNVTVALLIVVLALSVLFVGSVVQNEGCLPWQERVGYGDGVFGEGEDFSACR